MDLENFFPSIYFARSGVVSNDWTSGDGGGPLGGICTTIAPAEIWKKVDDESYARRHLPQGCPSVPVPADLYAYRLDCWLAGLAESAGAQLTRYSDDLAFSGDATFERHAEQFPLMGRRWCKRRAFWFSTERRV